jgi:hypothetical protein
MSVQLFAVVEVAPVIALFLAPSVPIGGDGHRLTVTWANASGATDVEVTHARLTVTPSVAEEVHADVDVRADGAGWSIAVPPGRRVRAIGLQGFKQPGGDRLRNSLPAGMRLTVAFPPAAGSGFDTPRFAVPAVARNHAVPPTLTGATFSNGTIQLVPAVAGSRVRLALVTGENPASFVDQATELGSVQLTTHTAARQARVEGPDGTVLWQVPEFDPAAPPAEIDLRQAIAAAFTSQLQTGSPLVAEVRLRAEAPAEARPSFAGASGFVVRREEGVVRTVVEGDPQPLVLAGPLAAETPSSVVGDLTIRYEGIRVLDPVSDPLPSPAAPVNGVVVGNEGVVRAFPPRAFDVWPPARIGVYGRAPEACELAIELVELVGDLPGTPVGPPAVLRVPAGAALQTWWAPVQADVPGDRAVGVRLRANAGRFFWVCRPDGPPLVRVAVHDPDPGGRELRLGEVVIARVEEPETHTREVAFPPAVFRDAAPVFRSDLFVTVDCSDLTLRYAR